MISADKGKLAMKPATRYLLEANVTVADGALWEMRKWWLEVPPAIPGAKLVAEGKRLWFVIEAPRFEEQADGSKPRLVAKAAMVLADIFPR